MFLCLRFNKYKNIMKKISNVILVLLISYNTYSQTLQQCTTDNNNDGVTNTTDFLNLVGQFGQNCAPLGTVSSFTCSDFINSGTLIQGSKASNVSSIISYTGGNGGDHNGQVVSSTGVTGLYAALQAGSFTSGAGNLTYMIFGTPTSSGTASFAINIGGQTCTLTRTVNGSGQTDIAAHSCGAANVHNSTKAYGTITDQQGNVYKTILIGNQEWMAENLKTSVYRNGDAITEISNNTQWASLTNGAWCHFENNSLIECPYGKLYNWFTIADPRGVCPTGWHIPTDGEWTQLTNFLGGEETAGSKMKSTGTDYWLSPNSGALNESGFSGLPGNYRYLNGEFQSTNPGENDFAAFWSLTELQSNAAWGRYLYYSSSAINRGSASKEEGHSIRCIRDANPPQGYIIGLNCDMALNTGSLSTGVESVNISSSLPYSFGNGGDHGGWFTTSQGVSGLMATLVPGSFNNSAGTLEFVISGTPENFGEALFELNIGGQTCTLSRTVNPPLGIITTLDCANANNIGILTSGVASVSVTSSIPYTGGNGGTHSGQTVTSTGVTGLTATLAPGSFSIGEDSLVYVISGTPVTSGTASFSLNIGGQACTLTRTVDLPIGSITALNCTSATNSGTLTSGVAASSVSSSVPYTGGNGGSHNGQTVTSTGVSGLTATLTAGSFVSGAGILTYVITGTPASSGTATFALNIGGRICTLSRNVIASIGSITALNCATATNSGILTQGVNASSVSSSVPYTGGNGGSHSGQTVTSTGVSGLTATLAAGNFANGFGNLIYTITGTPGSIGTASFALNIGGRICTLTRTVGQTGITQHSCGATNIHNPAKTYGSITDQQGNVYKTVVIGTQEWMAENLRTSIYLNGDPITNVTDATQWSNSTTGAWCNYDNNSSFDCPYGKLYNWYAVADSRKVCPTGWHVPTHSEWLTLSEFVGGSLGGGSIKSVGTQYWSSPNTDATNFFGFSGLPGGTRYLSFGYYGSIGFGGSWWASGAVNPWNAMRQFLSHSSGDFLSVDTPKVTGLSIRCIKD